MLGRVEAAVSATRCLASWAALACWLWVAVLADPAHAQLPSGGDSGLPYEVSADTLEYEAVRKLYVGRGNARITQGDRELRADWMAFSQLTGKGAASGNVVYIDGDDVLRAAFLEFDIDSLEGVIFDGGFVVDAGRMQLEGAEIQKTGDQTYRFEKGRFTTCDCPEDSKRDPWQIRAEKADLEIGGYGTARNTTFDVLGVPVVWLPWMIYPLKTERQTGFLLPTLGYGSRNGFEFAVPFFWAARHDLGITVAPGYMTGRGPQVELDVDYVFGEESWGNLFGAFVHDTKIDPNTPETPFGRERWAVFGNQLFGLPGGVRLRTDINYVSDNQVPFDFAQGSELRTDRFVVSTGLADRTFGPRGQLGAAAWASFAQDLQSPDGQDRDKFMLQRLPSVELDLAPVRAPLLSLLVPTFGVDYARFAGRQNATDVLPLSSMPGDGGAVVRGPGLFLDTGLDALPDVSETGVPLFVSSDRNNDNFTTRRGPENDGLFEEGEALADEGNRVLLTPRIGVPFRFFDVVELYPEVGWRQYLYDTDFQGFEQRGLLTARAELGTRLRASFGEISHILEPRFGWAFANRASQADQPLFIPRTAVPQSRLRELDLDNLTLDPADRFAEYNLLTLGFANRIFRNHPEHGALLLADFVLSAGYDFERGMFRDIYLDGTAYPTTRSSLRFNAGLDPNKTRLDEALVQGHYRTAGGHNLSLSYRYLRNIPRFFEDFRSNDRFSDFENFSEINQLSFGIGVRFLERWRLTYNFGYSFERSLMLVNRGGIEYTSGCKCWAGRLEVYQDRQSGVQFRILYRIMGLGRDSGWQGAGTPDLFD